MGGGTPSSDQMTEVIEVPVVRQVARGDYGFQDPGSLRQPPKACIGKLTVNPFLPTQGSAGPKFEMKGYGKRGTLVNGQIGD